MHWMTRLQRVTCNREKRGLRSRLQDTPRCASALAAARLSPQGVLVSNTLDESRAVAAELGRLFPSRLSIEVAGYDNRVFAASRRRLSAGALRAAVRADPVLRVTLPKFRLRGRSASRPSA